VKCNNCGEEINVSQKFCPNCGKEVEIKEDKTSPPHNSNDFKKQFGAKRNQSYNSEQKGTQVKDNDFKKQFGASSNAVYTKVNDNEDFIESNKRHFGASSNRMRTNFKTNFTNIFKLDDYNEWLKRYIISIVFFCLYVFWMEIQMNVFILILDLILFPFIICVVDHFIRKFINKSNYINDIGNLGCMFATAKFAIKYIFLLLIWNFSCILGIIALIYLYNLAKKIG